VRGCGARRAGRARPRHPSRSCPPKKLPVPDSSPWVERDGALRMTGPACARLSVGAAPRPCAAPWRVRSTKPLRFNTPTGPCPLSISRMLGSGVKLCFTVPQHDGGPLVVALILVALVSRSTNQQSGSDARGALPMALWRNTVLHGLKQPEGRIVCEWPRAARPGGRCDGSMYAKRAIRGLQFHRQLGQMVGAFCKGCAAPRCWWLAAVPSRFSQRAHPPWLGPMGSQTFVPRMLTHASSSLELASAWPMVCGNGCSASDVHPTSTVRLAAAQPPKGAHAVWADEGSTTWAEAITLRAPLASSATMPTPALPVQIVCGDGWEGARSWRRRGPTHVETAQNGASGRRLCSSACASPAPPHRYKVEKVEAGEDVRQ
jgi:hypothetical protein